MRRDLLLPLLPEPEPGTLDSDARESFYYSNGIVSDAPRYAVHIRDEWLAIPCLGPDLHYPMAGV